MRPKEGPNKKTTQGLFCLVGDVPFPCVEISQKDAFLRPSGKLTCRNRPVFGLGQNLFLTRRVQALWLCFV